MTVEMVNDYCWSDSSRMVIKVMIIMLQWIVVVLVMLNSGHSSQHLIGRLTAYEEISLVSLSWWFMKEMVQWASDHQRMYLYWFFRTYRIIGFERYQCFGWWEKLLQKYRIKIMKNCKVIINDKNITKGGFYFDCDGLTASLIGDITALSDSD